MGQVYFSPERDGINLTIKSLSENIQLHVTQVLRAKLPHIILQLKTLLGPSYHLCNLEESLNHFLQDALPKLNPIQDLSPLSLDYSSHFTEIPDHFKQVDPLEDQVTEESYKNIQERLFIHFEANCEKYLLFQLFQYIEIDHEVVRHIVTNPINKELDNMYLFNSYDVSLVLNYPESNVLFYEHGLTEFYRLKALLDAGSAGILRFISKELEQAFLIFSYTQTAPKTFECNAYNSNKSITVTIDFTINNQLILTGIQAQGFFLETYSAVRPLASQLTRFISYMLPKAFIYKFRRRKK